MKYQPLILLTLCMISGWRPLCAQQSDFGNVAYNIMSAETGYINYVGISCAGIHPFGRERNGKKDYYQTKAPFIFATKDGGKLVLVKNLREPGANAWHLKVIDTLNK